MTNEKTADHAPRSQRVWTCSCCGKVEAWGPSWRWKQKKYTARQFNAGRDPEVQWVACSDACAKSLDTSVAPKKAPKNELQRAIRAARESCGSAGGLAFYLAGELHFIEDDAAVLHLRRCLEHWEQGRQKPPRYFERWLVAKCEAARATRPPSASSRA